ARSYRRCPCPIWVQGTLGGETIRRAMDVTSIEAAWNLVAQWNAAGAIGAVKEEPARIDAAVAKYLDHARARHLAEATITKLITIFEKQFLAWTSDMGLRYLKELTPARLTTWRSTRREGRPRSPLPRYLRDRTSSRRRADRPSVRPPRPFVGEVHGEELRALGEGAAGAEAAVMNTWPAHPQLTLL